MQISLQREMMMMTSISRKERWYQSEGWMSCELGSDTVSHNDKARAHNSSILFTKTPSPVAEDRRVHSFVHV